MTLNDKTVSANCLVGTDGTDSFVRQQARIGVTRKDYHQKALVATIDLHHSHAFTAYERWVDDTAIALLPHSPWRSVLIWSGHNDYMDELMAYEDPMFLSHLQHAVGYRLGKLSSVSERYAYPLFQVQADKVVEKRLLLMGNAAQTLHPMGAQGFNLAVKHVALFSHLLRERRRNGETDISLSLLSDYAEQQEKETARTLAFTDRAVELSSHIGPLNTTARTLLINALGSSRIAQRALLYTR
ncbi:MAG: FAD-dependent monooxygenase [Gammaproteobacteria bacterium]|nr:FAD-dependent monooxygenase [Gammaproteobacteria bacterium]